MAVPVGYGSAPPPPLEEKMAKISHLRMGKFLEMHFPRMHLSPSMPPPPKKKKCIFPGDFPPSMKEKKNMVQNGTPRAPPLHIDMVGLYV